MDLNILKTFIAVCEYSGFSAAAEKLGYTQSTVSSQIKQLENELNTVLFDRYYHRINLTQDGVKALRHAKDIIGSYDQMVAETEETEELSGTIRLAMSSSICNRYFRDDFLKFHQKYPRIRLIATESGTEQMFDMLKKNEVDLVFTLDQHFYEADFEICAERREDVHFIAAVNNPLIHRENISIEEISRCSSVLTENNMSYRILLNSLLAEKSLEIQPILEVGNPLQICSIVRKSELISFLPDFITEEYVKAGKVAYLPVDNCSISVWTQLLIHKNKWKSPTLTAFLDYYREIINK